MFLDNPRKISDTEDSEEDSTELQNAVRTLIADLQAIDERVKSLERDNNTLKQVASKRFKASMSAKKMSKKTRGKMSEGERDIESPIIRSSFGGKLVSYFLSQSIDVINSCSNRFLLLQTLFLAPRAP